MKEEKKEYVLTPLTLEEMAFWGEANAPWMAADLCDEDPMLWTVEYVKEKVEKGEDLYYWLHMCQLTMEEYEEGLVKYKDQFISL